MMESFSHIDKTFSQEMLWRECDNLTAEINRLKDQLHMQERRLKNVMDLVINIIDVRILLILLSGVQQREYY